MATISYGLNGKVFLVTGGSRGIGFEIAKMMLAEGAKVAICGRKQEGLDAAAAELAAGENLLAVSAHVAKEEDVNRMFDQVVEQFGTIDGLVNNVGMNIATGAVDADFGLWQKIVDSNLNGTFLCSRKAGQIMREKKQGKIVSITSIAARRAAPFMGIYGVAKAGIEMMTRVLAQELAPFNIQVNAVAPCMVRTKFSQPFWSNADIHDQIVKTVPLGRIAEPADVAHPTLFFCSEAANFITGQILMVDGGATAV
ncbi:MAG: SDR family oxidoreductase [Desulfobacterales bacterium]|nr:SDR family oxidoreductase [Desulfobacterales bacterium]